VAALGEAAGPLEPSDDLGPLKVLRLRHQAAGLDAVVVVDNTALGPALGGVRMAPDVTTQECARLARAMTLKNSAAGLAHGGGKAVIAADPGMPAPEKEHLVRRFASLIRNEVDYIPGPDMGTDETCMAWIRDEIGRAAGLPEELGGIPLDRIGATGFGLAHAIEVAVGQCDFGLAGARVVVQGFGAVGKHAARFLRDRGAVLVGAADSRGSIYDPRGLDLVALIRAKDEGRSVAEVGAGEAGDGDAVLDMECEIWIPAARPDVVTEKNVGRLRTKLVAEGANIPVTPGAERALAERGVLVLPDFIANAGGVIAAAVEVRGGVAEDAFATIERKIRANTGRVLALARERAVLPRAAAVAFATERVRAAMGYGRWR
jgi:glutamate dehydrogenase/leucine dehydrogenase